MSSHYVSSQWQVKPGCEDEFVAAFESLALWAELNHPEGGTARLLQSVEDTSRVTCVWEFPGAEAIARWREQSDVVEHLARLEELAALVDEGVYELRVVVGG